MASEAIGRGFESLRAHHHTKANSSLLAFLLSKIPFFLAFSEIRSRASVCQNRVFSAPKASLFSVFLSEGRARARVHLSIFQTLTCEELALKNALQAAFELKKRRLRAQSNEHALK